MALAAPSLRIASASASLLPRAFLGTSTSTSRFASFVTRQLSFPLFPSFVFAVPTAAIQWNIPSLPSLLDGIWESILRAVPKKKTTHSKKRHRQMAGKALKDVTALCKCPACGGIKRMHYLCPHCTTQIRNMLAAEDRAEKKKAAAPTITKPAAETSSSTTASP